MASRVSIKSTATANLVPSTNLVDAGELVINTADGKLFSSNGSDVFEVGANLSSLFVSGEITATGDITAFFSDERLKDRYENIPQAVKKVKALNGFYYEPNELAQSLGYVKQLYIGLSAQEVEKVVPEVIKPAPIDNKYLTVDYAKLVPLLVEAIKEQQERIDLLELNIKLLGK
jgi:hypothetical protein